MTVLSFVQEILENWTLVSLFSIFVFVILWSFRPGSRVLHDDAAQAVFRHDTPMSCGAACPGCCSCTPTPGGPANG
jgi:cytochrome c oxidase cbb3-type subunit 4